MFVRDSPNPCPPVRALRLTIEISSSIDWKGPNPCPPVRALRQTLSGSFADRTTSPNPCPPVRALRRTTNVTLPVALENLGSESSSARQGIKTYRDVIERLGKLGIKVRFL